MRYNDVGMIQPKNGILQIWKIHVYSSKSKYMERFGGCYKFINKDLLYKGYTIQPYSPKAGTGLSSRQSKTKPGSYRDVTDTTVVLTTGIVNL
jgi:isoleucyl-tRNA synthetase